MRFVAVKSIAQQGALVVHRSRDLLVRQRTQLVNALRAHLAELGLVAAQGREGVAALIALVRDEAGAALPEPMRAALLALICQLEALAVQIGALEKTIHDLHRASDASRRLETIPGIGIIAANTLAVSVTDPSLFRSGRDLAAWIGLVPRQNSSGGKERLGPISKQGDRTLRRLLVLGAAAMLKQARAHPDKHPWLTRLLARRPAKVAMIALANKMARIAWAVLAKGGTYRAPAHAASEARGLAMGV